MKYSRCERVTHLRCKQEVVRLFSPFTFSLTFYCRKRTGPLTSAGVPSPPLSHGAASRSARGIQTAAPLLERRVNSPKRRRNNNEDPPGGRAAVCALSVTSPPRGPALVLCSAHTLGLTVFPEVPSCQVTLYPSATTARAFPCKHLQHPGPRTRSTASGAPRPGLRWCS